MPERVERDPVPDGEAPAGEDDLRELPWRGTEREDPDGGVLPHAGRSHHRPGILPRTLQAGSGALRFATSSGVDYGVFHRSRRALEATDCQVVLGGGGQ